MRVGINEVLLYPWTSGAVSRELTVLPELLRRMEGEGHESVVYFSRDMDDDTIDRLTGGTGGVRAIKTPLPSLPTCRRILRGIPYWPRQVERDGVDLFHTAYYPIPRLNIPVVLTVHDMRLIHMPETYRRWRYLFLKMVIPRSLSRASRIIAVSRDTKRDLIRHFGLSEDKIDVSYNPLPPGFRIMDSDEIPPSISSKYRLPGDYLLHVGKLEPRKNLRRLIEAYHSIREKTACKLVITGKKAWAYQGLVKVVRERELEDDVIFTGYVEDEDLPPVYNMARALVYPSLHEGFGIPALEAMACGLPVVASGLPALREVVGEAAVFVDPHSTDSIARGIVKIIEDSSLRERLISEGLNRSSRFTPGETASRVIRAYEKASG